MNGVSFARLFEFLVGICLSSYKQAIPNSRTARTREGYGAKQVSVPLRWTHTVKAKLAYGAAVSIIAFRFVALLELSGPAFWWILAHCCLSASQ